MSNEITCTTTANYPKRSHWAMLRARVYRKSATARRARKATPDSAPAAERPAPIAAPRSGIAYAPEGLTERIAAHHTGQDDARDGLAHLVSYALTGGR
jgi:hypothetical protein